MPTRQYQPEFGLTDPKTAARMAHEGLTETRTVRQFATKWLVAVLVFSAAVTLPAAENSLQDLRRHTCKIAVFWQSGARNYGTGVYLGDRLVLTCAHLFRPDASDGAMLKIQAAWPGGDVRNATLAKSDGLWDQAVIEVDQQPHADGAPLPGIPLAADEVAEGDFVIFGGYGNTQRLTLRRGQIRNYAGASGIQFEPGYINARGMSDEGDSGGPMFNDRGELVGNLSASDHVETTGTREYKTREFLAPFEARLTQARLTWGRTAPPASGGYGQPVSCGVPRLQLPQPTTYSQPTTSRSRNQVYVKINYAQLAAQLKADPDFVAACKGLDALPPKIDYEQLAAMAVQHIDVNTVASVAATKIDINAVAQSAAAHVDINQIAAAIAQAIPPPPQKENGTNATVDQKPDDQADQADQNAKPEPTGGPTPAYFSITPRTGAN